MHPNFSTAMLLLLKTRSYRVFNVPNKYTLTIPRQ